MLSQKYQAMLNKKSAIMELSALAHARAQEIGEENVFDFSLGNPSVPAPKAYNARIIELLLQDDIYHVLFYSTDMVVVEARD